MYPVERWSAAYILYFAPTMCVYGLCFKITDRLLPEAGAVIKAVFKTIYIIIGYVKSTTEEEASRAEKLDLLAPPLKAEPVASMKANTTN